MFRMQYFSLLTPEIGFVAGLGALLLILLVLEVYNSRHLSRLSSSLIEDELHSAHETAEHILAEARGEVSRLAGEAEKESAEHTNAHRATGEAAEQIYEESLRGMLSRLEASLLHNAE